MNVVWGCYKVLAICQALKTILEYLRILYSISSTSHMHCNCNSDYSWFHASWHRLRKHVSYMSSLRLQFFIDRKLPSNESSLWSCTKETCLLNAMTGGMLVDRLHVKAFWPVQQSATAVAPTGVLRKTYFVRTIIRNHECNMEGSSTQDHLMSSASRLVGNFSTFLPHLGHTNREVKPEVQTVENLAKFWLT